MWSNRYIIIYQRDEKLHAVVNACKMQSLLEPNLIPLFPFTRRHKGQLKHTPSLFVDVPSTGMDSLKSNLKRDKSVRQIISECLFFLIPRSN